MSAATFGAVLLAGVVMFSGAAAAAERLQPPPGYLAPIGEKSGSFDCPQLPAPFTATLDFPSKYAGSGKARDQLNEASDAEYKAKSKPVTDMEKEINKVVEKFVDTGRPEALKCALDGYLAWAKAGALLGDASSHTGKSVRKWSLASLSGAWLHLKFSSSQPLAAFPEQTRTIDAWLGHVAEKVVTEWDEGEKLEKINNHFYWAAWSVMATGVALDRRDLFDWAVKMYRIFAKQVDSDGFLPNELNRQTRALGYHNFAITPIAMIAAFGRANGLDLPAEGNGALTRLATRTLAGVDDPKVFEAKTGKRQELEGFDEQNTKLAWLEPYCWATSCSGSAAQKLGQLRPLKNTRLGGDMTATFAAKK